jgi:hypothetical protein
MEKEVTNQKTVAGTRSPPTHLKTTTTMKTPRYIIINLRNNNNNKP